MAIYKLYAVSNKVIFSVVACRVSPWLGDSYYMVLSTSSPSIVPSCADRGVHGPGSGQVLVRLGLVIIVYYRFKPGHMSGNILGIKARALPNPTLQASGWLKTHYFNI